MRIWWVNKFIHECVPNRRFDLGDVSYITRVQSQSQEDPPGEGHGNPLQDSCLENPVDRGAWWAIVRVVTRVRHNLVTKLPPPSYISCVSVYSRISSGTSLVVQWLRIWLPVQGTWVQSLVLELRSHMPQGNYACVPQLETQPKNIYIYKRISSDCSSNDIYA